MNALNTKQLPAQTTKAAFIEPMLLLRTEALPEGANWAYGLFLPMTSVSDVGN
jgi:hypothetical protein